MAVVERISQSYRVAPTHARLVASDAHGWMRRQLPEEVGTCYCERFSLDDDLMLIRSRYRPLRDLIEETVNPHDRHMLVITYGMQGDSGYRGAEGSAVAFRAGHTTVTAFRLSRGERRYQAGASVSQLRLLIGQSTLDKYLGEQRTRQLLGNGNLCQLALQKTSAACASHAGALAHPCDPGVSEPLNLHIHALSLLSEQLRLLSPASNTGNLRLSAVDIEKLDRVRDIMIEQLEQPLTIPYLCAAVGLNEFKLKEGLRHRFNSTPHRMLHEMRMSKAHALLESGCQVAQAAYQVGYRFPNNFSAAFTRFFGKTPKSVFGKQRR